MSESIARCGRWLLGPDRVGKARLEMRRTPPVSGGSERTRAAVRSSGRFDAFPIGFPVRVPDTHAPTDAGVSLAR